MAEKGTKKRTKNEAVSIQEALEGLKDMITEYRKIVFPVLLIAAFLITMGIAMAVNRKKQQQEEVQANAQPEQERALQDGLIVPEDEMEENAYPEINELIMKYYKALEEENTDALTEIVSPLTDSVLIRFTEWAKYIEAFPTVNIYTKKGPREDSFIAYVVSDVQVVGFDEIAPGMVSFFVCKNEAGNYYINMEEEIEKEEADYIEALNFQDDVKDLSNKISAEFNQLVQSAEMSKAFIKVEESITKGIQEALLAQRAAEAPEDGEAGDAPEEMPAVAAAKKAKAADVVNMRSSDSEKADKLGKAQIGDTFDVVEQKANGWTKLSDGTKEFFIKSEYLEFISEEPAGGETAQGGQAQEPAGGNTLPGSDGYVTAKTTVNIRKSASETGEKLGKAYQGEKLELVMNQADGWSKIKYKGQTAYVKSEFVK